MFGTIFKIIRVTFIVMALIGGFAVFLIMLKIFVSNFIHLRRRYIQKAKEEDDDL